MSLAPSQGGVPHQTGHQGMTPAQRLASVNEETWLQIGKLAELMNELDRAMAAYESALRQNPYSIPAMDRIASILRVREQFERAVEYFQSILNLDQNNGETWGSLGHCYLMMDDLQKAYSAYQQALYHLQNPKEPKLWYGIGILYDRYGSLEHAEEAFSQVMRMDASFDKANEIYFRLGIIYKQQQKYAQSLECFNYIITNPPKPLTEVDIWFQIGHVYEQQKEYSRAKEAYERVLRENPDHAKVLQQLGWLYHQSSEFADQDLAVSLLTKSIESDGTDAQSWYLLGRCYMAQRKYNKAYEAYQQAVYRDGRNPTFWCSIGVLYYQINQYRDALDAYSRAIRLNPYISEVWYDLGTLYESCNNQTSDALDAYVRASELDPGNPHIKARLELLRNGQATGVRPNQGGGPHPQDINPHAYQNVPQGPPQQWNRQQGQNAHQPPQQQQQQPPPPPHHHHQHPHAHQQQQHQHQNQSQPLQHHLQHQHQHQQQQQNPPHQQQQQHELQQRQGPALPSQNAYRPPETQAMRPPQSPDRSKPRNDARGTSSKAEPVSQNAQYQSQSVQQFPAYTAQQSPSNQLPAMGETLPPAPAPMEGANLAPILGRTTPVTEIEPLASRDDAGAPREQAPKFSHQATSIGRLVTPQNNSQESSETVSLKRACEWDSDPHPPEAKKQETQELRNGDRIDQDLQMPDREASLVEEPRATSEEPTAQSAIPSSAIVESEKKAAEEETPAKHTPVEAVQDVPTKAPSPTASPHDKDQSSKVTEAAERKVQLDENYDDEE